MLLHNTPLQWRSLSQCTGLAHMAHCCSRLTCKTELDKMHCTMALQLRAWHASVLLRCSHSRLNCCYDCPYKTAHRLLSSRPTHVFSSTLNNSSCCCPNTKHHCWCCALNVMCCVRAQWQNRWLLLDALLSRAHAHSASTRTTGCEQLVLRYLHLQHCHHQTSDLMLDVTISVPIIQSIIVKVPPFPNGTWNYKKPFHLNIWRLSDNLNYTHKSVCSLIIMVIHLTIIIILIIMAAETNPHICWCLLLLIW